MVKNPWWAIGLDIIWFKIQIMPEEMNPLDKQEALKAENDFLKMKLMLEHGAIFGPGEANPNVPAEIENEFLKQVARFEDEWSKLKRITIFEKIGKPTHFKPVAEIPPGKIRDAWCELFSYMIEHGVQLDACSPNVTEQELYRFTIEELFNEETEDMDIPGMMTCYIYDEFHPDPVYDNTRMVENDLLNDIFSARELFREIQYNKSGFVFNGKKYDDWASFKKKIDNFKSLFDKFSMELLSTESCEVSEKDCCVRGQYAVKATSKNEAIHFKGGFKVKLVKDEFNYWNFSVITIEGFNLE